ncbi:MAG: VOC family protein [Phycisphaerae bacterium]
MIQTRDWRPVATLSAIREVRIEMPSERFAAARAFYEDLLGIRAWRPSENIPGCLGFGPLRRGLIMLPAHDPDIDACKPRLNLLIDDLEKLAKWLSDLEIPFTALHGIGAYGRSLFVHDPAGHLLLVRESRNL